MIRRPPRSTQSRSSAASDVYKRQLPHVGVYRPQRGLLAVDLFTLDHRGGDQRAVERVAPRVVRTAQVAAYEALLVVADARPAMATDVVETADLLVLAAHDQQALPGDLDAQPRAGLGQPLGPTDVDPVAVENPLLVDAVGLL